MIIDVHTHLNNYEEDKKVSIHENLDKLQENMSKNGVDAAFVLTSYKVNEHRPSTRDVVEVTRDIDNLFVVAGISYLNYKEKDLREISDYLKDGLVKGLKLYPGYEPFYPHNRRLQVIYDLALEFDVPVMIHSGDTYSPKAKVRYAHPLHIDDVAVDNPGLKLVICHLGNPWIMDCMQVVYKNENVYADFSGLVLGDFTDQFERYMKKQIEDMIIFAGEPEYLLFGTDWPISSMGSYSRFMKDLDMEPATKELILWKNTARLFKLDVEKLS